MLRLHPRVLFVRALLLVAFAPALMSLPLIAQDAIKPKKPHIVIETVGPDGWRTRLGPSNVATMLASEAGRAIWQPQLDPILGIWQMMVGDEEAFAAASKRIFAYGGTIRVAVTVNKDAAAHVAVMLEPDGRTDLSVLAADIRSLIERGVPGEWQHLSLADRKLTVRGAGHDAITEPILEAGRMYLVAGNRETIADGMGLAAHLLARPVTMTQPKPGSPALHLVLDAAALTKLHLDDAESAKIADALGLMQLAELSFSLKAAGPQIELDVSMSLNGTARGMVAAFLPNSQGISALSQLLPSKASAWKIGRFDCSALYDGIVDAIAHSGWAQNPDKLHEEINESCGTDVKNQLLRNMTDELLVVGSPFQDFDKLDETTWLIAFRLKNTAEFQKSFLAMMQQAKPMLSGSETVDVDGIELRRYGNMFSYDVWMAAGNGVFVLSAGRDAEEQASNLLRKAKTMSLAATAAPMAGFEALKRYLPPGQNGIAQADLSSLLAIPSEWWVDIANKFLPMLQGPRSDPEAQLDPEEAAERQHQFHELLKAHNLTVVRSATGFADARFYWRLFW